MQTERNEERLQKAGKQLRFFPSYTHLVFSRQNKFQTEITLVRAQ